VKEARLATKNYLATIKSTAKQGKGGSILRPWKKRHFLRDVRETNKIITRKNLLVYRRLLSRRGKLRTLLDAAFFEDEQAWAFQDVHPLARV
jgi:hypothetical protein